MDEPNYTEDNCEADKESNIELDNAVDDPESSVVWDVIAALNVPGLIRPTCRLRKIAEKVLIMVSTMHTSRNKGNKKK